MNFNGRRKIYTAADAITDENVIAEVNLALESHIKNVFEENYLYWYRRGRQPILERTKEIRPEICNRIVINNADMVVTFKNGYFLTKPAAYVSRKEDVITTEKVKTLNEFLHTSNKQNVDNEIVNWFHTVGLAALFVEPNKYDTETTPANVYCLDPRSAFVVYSLKPGNAPMMGVNMVVDKAKKIINVDVFTEDAKYTLTGTANMFEPEDEYFTTAEVNSIVGKDKNVIGLIPIIEYQYNENRMSAFESAMPIMDEINNVESNRIDGVEQFVQSLIVTTNVDFDDETITANKIRQSGMINLKSQGENKADIKILNEQLDQSQTQTTLDNLYEQMLDKTGVPSSVRDSGSTSDNVGAVYLRSGWAMADTHARNCEDCFKKSNRLFDRVFIEIIKRASKGKFEIGMSEFELKVIRNDMSNLLVKTQAAMNMKQLGFSPVIAFERSGLSNDPISDVENSQKYIDAMWNPQTQVAANNPVDGGNANSNSADNNDGNEDNANEQTD